MTNTDLPKLRWLLIDGLPFKFLSTICELKASPWLKKIIDSGRVSRLSPLQPNCQTPPSLCSIWSGTDAETHKIIGYDMPNLSDSHYLGVEKGFDANTDQIDFVWDHYAKEGKSIVLSNIPFVNQGKLGDSLLCYSNVYASNSYPTKIAAAEDPIDIPEIEVSLFLERSESGAVKELVARSYTGEQQRFTLKKDTFQTVKLDCISSHKLEPLGRALKVMHAPVNGVDTLFVLGASSVYCSGKASQKYNDNGTGQPFITSALNREYRIGRLGKKLKEGGDGRAEEYFLKSVEQMHESFCQELILQFSNNKADLVIGYYPVVDILLHELMHIFDPSGIPPNSSTEKAIILRIWKMVENVLEQLSSLSHQSIFIANSDHGMQQVFTTFYLNECLSEKGLLSFDALGEIEWESSTIVYHPSENGSIAYNSRRLNKLGYSADDVKKLIKQIFKKYFSLDASILTIEWFQNDLDKEWRVDLFLNFQWGVRVKASRNDKKMIPSDKQGDHCAANDDPWLEGVLFDLSTIQNKNLPKIMSMSSIMNQILEA